MPVPVIGGESTVPFKRPVEEVGYGRASGGGCNHAPPEKRKESIKCVIKTISRTSSSSEIVVGASAPSAWARLWGLGWRFSSLPKRVRRHRRRSGERAKKLRIAAEERVREAQLHLEDRMEAVREGVQSQVGLVKDAVESGRQAAEAARSDLGAKLERSKAAARAGIAAAKEASADGDGSQEEGVGE